MSESEDFTEEQINSFKKVIHDECNLNFEGQDLLDYAKLPVCQSLIRSLTREKEKETLNQNLLEENEKLKLKILAIEKAKKLQLNVLLANGELIHDYKESIKRFIIEFNKSTGHSLTWDLEEDDFSADPDGRAAMKFQYGSLRTIETWIRSSVFQLNEMKKCQKVVQKTLVAGFGIKEAP